MESGPIFASVEDESRAREIIISGLGELAIPQEMALLQRNRKSIRKIIRACECRHAKGEPKDWPKVLAYAVVALISDCEARGQRPTLRRLLQGRRQYSVEGYQRLLVERGSPKVYAHGRTLTPQELCPWAYVTTDSGPDDEDESVPA